MKFARNALNLLAIAGVIMVSFVAQPASAVAPEDLTILISDSRPSTAANYTITHDQVATTGDFSADDTMVVTFPAGFDLTSLSSPGDFDFSVDNNATDETLQSGACGATDTVRVTISGQAITFEACDSFVGDAAGTIIVIEIGTHATSGASGVNRVTNHATPATYTISTDTTDEDSKDALIVVIAGVTVTAIVDESLTVAVNGLTAGSCTDNGGTPTIADTTATAIPLGYSGATPGNVSGNTFYAGCQRVDVGTNAAGGYNVTVRQTQLLTSGGNTIAEGTCDAASCNDTTLGGWETATNNGFGYCADDQTGNAGADAGIAAGDQCDDATPLYYTFFTAPDAPTTDFMFSSGPVSSDQTNIAYHLSVPGNQAAGTYTNVMVYVATATF